MQCLIARRAVVQRSMRRLAALWMLLSLVSVGACSDRKAEPSANPPITGLELTCIYNPGVCNNEKLVQLYGAPADRIVERRFHGRELHVPIGYLDDTELLVDPRYPKEKSDLFLVALLPDLRAREPSNLPEFFAPYERNLMRIVVGVRGTTAMPWTDSLEWLAKTNPGEMLSPVRRQDKFGLSVVGEDYERNPARRPCARLGEDKSQCWQPHAQDVLRPVQPNGPPSLMLCDPEILPDIDQKVLEMRDTERNKYYASKRWFGERRAMCKHYLLYAPFNATIRLTYPRRFIAQWRATEDRVRALLDAISVDASQRRPASAAR